MEELNEYFVLFSFQLFFVCFFFLEYEIYVEKL